jgi:phytol kinase
LVVLLIGLRWMQRRFDIGPELSRKLFHICGGVVSLLLPWIFSSTASVAVLTGFVTAVLLAIRLLPRLRGSLGLVLSSVHRPSWGELCFPVSVLLLFALSHEHKVFFVVPLLILTFADSVAALIGSSYGRVKYMGTEAPKSVEGSAAFFIVGFLSVHVPLLLRTNIGRPESLLVALILAFLLVLLEAVSWAGLDNLFVPVCAYVLLHNLTSLTAPDLLTRFIIMVTSTIGILLWGRRTTLNLSGLMGGFLLCYAVWMMADWRWVLMPVILFFAHPFLSPKSTWNQLRVHNVHVLLSIFSAGLIWLLAGYVLHRDFFYPYAVSFAAHLAIIGAVRQDLSLPGVRKPLMHSFLAWALIFAVYLLVKGAAHWELLRTGFAFPCVLVAVLLHGKIANEDNRWEWEAAAAGFVSVPAILW